jgi:hypothetical protein
VKHGRGGGRGGRGGGETGRRLFGPGRGAAWAALNGPGGPGDSKLSPDVNEVIYAHLARETAAQDLSGSKKKEKREEGRGGMPKQPCASAKAKK